MLEKTMLLGIENLKVWYKIKRGWVKAIDDSSLKLDNGDCLGIAGESGSGKTSLIMSIIRLLPRNASIIGGKIFFNEKNIIKYKEEEMIDIRWKEISLIPQGALNVLNPVIRVGDQIREALKAHEDIPKEKANKRVNELLSLVGINPSIKKHYPHEFSGGMRQRVLIAMSLICKPKLILADEPTTALDVIIQDRILKRIKDLQNEYKFSMIMVSHDIAILAETCNKMAVMYGGKIVECADTKTIFRDTRHPYTLSLLNSIPSIKGDLKRLKSLKGHPPNLVDPPPGCLFRARCPFQKDICKEDPPIIEISDEHYSKCHFADNKKILEKAV